MKYRETVSLAFTTLAHATATVVKVRKKNFYATYGASKYAQSPCLEIRPNVRGTL